MPPKPLYRWMNQSPLIVYGLLYASVTLIFAAMYWMMPGAFYHSTAMHEPMLKRDAEQIRSGLERAFLYQGLKNNEQEVFKSHEERRDVPVICLDNDIEYAIRSFTVYDVQYENGRFRISTTMNGEHTCAAIPGIIITARTENDYFEDTTVEETVVAAEFESAGKEEHTGVPAPPMRSPYDIFIAMPKEGNKPIEGFLKIPRDLFEMMNAYADAMDGFAGLALGSFWRMLYLSTVTITTLGYGDIVPITPVSRALVGAEAILGILIIGLYLNALSQRLVSETPQSQ